MTCRLSSLPSARLGLHLLLLTAGFWALAAAPAGGLTVMPVSKTFVPDPGCVGLPGVVAEFCLSLENPKSNEEAIEFGLASAQLTISFAGPALDGTVQRIELFTTAAKPLVFTADSKPQSGYAAQFNQANGQTIVTGKAPAGGSLPAIKMVRITAAFATPGHKKITLDAVETPKKPPQAFSGSAFVEGNILNVGPVLVLTDKNCHGRQIDYLKLPKRPPYLTVIAAANKEGAVSFRVMCGQPPEGPAMAYPWSIRTLKGDKVLASGTMKADNRFSGSLGGLAPGNYFVETRKEVAGVLDPKFELRIDFTVIYVDFELIDGEPYPDPGVRNASGIDLSTAVIKWNGRTLPLSRFTLTDVKENGLVIGKHFHWCPHKNELKSGPNTLSLFVKDHAGNTIEPNPTVYTITIP